MDVPNVWMLYVVLLLPTIILMAAKEIFYEPAMPPYPRPIRRGL